MHSRRHFPALVLFLALTVLLTNPLVLHLGTAVEDKQDALLNTWIIAWVGHAFVTNPLTLFDANIFYPYANTLAFSELNIPQGLLAFPFTSAAHNSVFGYNLVLLAGFALDAFGIYLFAFDLTRRRGPALVAGVIYAFNSYNLGNLAQEQLVWLGFMPLALLYLQRIAPLRPSSSLTGGGHVRLGKDARHAFLLALFFSLETLASIYYGFLSGIAIGVYLLWWLGARGRDLFGRETRGAWVRTLGLVAAVGVMILMLIGPFLLPYFQVQRTLGFERTLAESEPFSANLHQFTEVAAQNVLYGEWLAPRPPVYLGGYPLDNLFPGMVALILAVLGLATPFARRMKGYLLALLLLAFVFSFGPRLYLSPHQPTTITLPYAWLYHALPFLRALRAPVRFEALILLALALLAAFGARAVLAMHETGRSGKQSDRTPRAGLFFQRANGINNSQEAGRAGGVLSLALVALIALEYANVPAANVVPVPVGSDIPKEYLWLATQPPGVILEYPMLGPDAQGQLDITPQYLSTYHWQRTPDGYSGFNPPRRGEIAYEMQAFPSERSLRLLAALDVRYLIVHTDRLPEADRTRLGEILPEVNALEPVRTFGATQVYQLRPYAPGTPRLDVQGYLPNPLTAGAPFLAYLIVSNRDAWSLALKPTSTLSVSAHWSDGRVENVDVPLPLVTSRVSVVPLPLHAPAALGSAQVELRAENTLLGNWTWSGGTRVGTEGARQIVIPARVQAEGTPDVVRRGETLMTDLVWTAENKTDAYYSASLRLVDAQGKRANADRQPNPATLLWQPLNTYRDRWALAVPPDLAPGSYHLHLLMYQADDGTSVLLLDAENRPTDEVDLGEVIVE